MFVLVCVLFLFSLLGVLCAYFVYIYVGMRKFPSCGITKVQSNLNLKRSRRLGFMQLLIQADAFSVKYVFLRGIRFKHRINVNHLFRLLFQLTDSRLVQICDYGSKAPV